MLRTLGNSETNKVRGGVHLLKMFNNCVSNGMNFAGMGYAIGAHMHDQQQQAQQNQQGFIPRSFAGTKIAITFFAVGCSLSLADDIANPNS
jgi:hypothetical protein